MEVQEIPAERGTPKKKKVALLVLGIVVIVGTVTGLIYREYSKTHIGTDDAYVEGPLHVISPKISGTVLHILVKDNQMVKAGDLLVEIEPDIYTQQTNSATSALGVEDAKISEYAAMISAQQTRVRQAEASLELTKAAKEELKAAVSAREADLAEQEALQKEAETNLKRAEKLLAEEVITQDRYDHDKTAYDTAVAKTKAASETLKQAQMVLVAQDSAIAHAEASVKAEEAMVDQLKASMEGQKQKVAQKQADLDLAELKLSYTQIYAPVDGYVTRKSIEVGNTVSAGQPLMAIVPLGMQDIYIVANYKETQLQRIRPGQKVKIAVDAYPGKVFWGKVDSIMAGTGSAFSLFPPENATGNYVKIVQRVPVKIVLDKGTDTEHLLRIGLSVSPVVLAE